MDHHFNQWTDSIVSNVVFDDGFPLDSSLDKLEFFKLPESFGFECNNGPVNTSPGLDQSSGIHSFAPFYDLSSVSDFSDDNESYPVLNYLNNILMEEEETTVCDDPLALQEKEKFLGDVLGHDFQTLPHESFNQTTYGFDSFDRDSLRFVTGSSLCGPVDSLLVAEPCLPSGKADESLEFVSRVPLENSSRNCDVSFGGIGSSSVIPSMFTDNETISLFKKGLEEGNKFLLTNAHFFLDLGKDGSPLTQEKEAFSVDEVRSSARFSRRKHRYQDSIGRSSKHSAIYEEEVDLAETFDKILLHREGISDADAQQLTKKKHQKDSNRSKKGGTNAISVDLLELLISCSQSVAANDLSTANEQLRLIKHHASSTGNSYQRLAIPFSKGLEARIEGTGSEVYANLVSKHSLSSEELKAFRVFLCAPFKQIFCFFANSMILEALSKATTLHIIDFGINYGFQWPSLIKKLSNRPLGPPKLRITGIDFPEPGFRPADRIEATGRRLAEYCKRFEVPFEYHAIASSKWEDINIEDLNLKRNEVLAVNCQWRFRSVLDETAEKGCPRDAVLNLIRDMKPDIFVHDVINAQFGSPFFLTRFKDAIFFFSTVFDILDQNLPRDDPHRIKYEMDYMGMDIINIVSCEGMARIDRPETYKQWQNRYQRAGFKLLPLNKALMKELRDKVKEGYHKDFIFDDDGHWLMLGWKGKIITASSCLIPA